MTVFDMASEEFTSLLKENEELRSVIEKIKKLVDQYSWNVYYYKCDSKNKFYKSEIINDLKGILEKAKLEYNSENV